MYCNVGWSAEPGSVAWPLNATGRPQSAVVAGPAFALGAAFDTETSNERVAVFPVTSVAVSWPSYRPLSANERCGVGPYDVVPFENCQISDAIGHCESVVAENWIGLPSAPANGPIGPIVGTTSLALSGPRSKSWPAPSSGSTAELFSSLMTVPIAGSSTNPDGSITPT